MKLFLPFLTFFTSLFAALKPISPLYTGSLLSLSGKVMDVGSYSLQPYIFLNDDYGVYDDHFSFSSKTSLYQIQTLVLFEGGLTSFADFQITGQTFSNFKKNASSINVGDTSVLIGLQICRENLDSSMPNIRLTITETFPTGKYDNLSPSKLGTDQTGEGTYETILGLNYQKIFYPNPCHPLRLRINLSYSIPSDLQASNIHAYGGQIGAKDHVSPGYEFFFLISPEYSLTKRWVLTADFTYGHTWRTIVKRENKGIDKGKKSTLPSQDLFTIAPAIEYNFSNNLGVIGGFWMSLAGRNTNAFASTVFSLVYNF